MKIRIKGNSIRIRLSRTEVSSFGQNGYLEEKTEFGTSTFIYAMQIKKGAVQMTADFSDDKITMHIPSSIAEEWTTTDIVGFNNNLDLGNGQSLFLLIEKDFKCIDNTTEDQSDNYDHPLITCN